MDIKTVGHGIQYRQMLRRAATFMGVRIAVNEKKEDSDLTKK